MSRFAYLLPPSLQARSAASTSAALHSSEICHVPDCSYPVAVKCLGCKLVGYCSEMHLRLDWSTHILSCTASLPGSSLNQLGLLLIGSSTAPHPVAVPKSLGHLSSLNRPHLGSLLIPPCPPERVKVVVCPITVALGRGEELVLAYDAGPKGQRMEGGLSGIVFNSAPGELNRPAIEFTRSLLTGRGLHLRGSCLVFFLTPGRDLHLDTDWGLIEDVCLRGAWPVGSGAATEEVVERVRKGYQERREQAAKDKEDREKLEKLLSRSRTTSPTVSVRGAPWRF